MIEKTGIICAPAWPLLPLIRVLPEYTSPVREGEKSIEPFEEVLGIFESELILFRKRRRIDLPLAAGEPGGESVLKNVRSKGKKCVARWEEVAHVLASKPIKRGSHLTGGFEVGIELRFKFLDGKVWPLFLPNHEAVHVLAALKSVLSDRLVKDMEYLPRTKLRPRRRPAYFLAAFVPGLPCLVALLFGVLVIGEILRQFLRRKAARIGHPIIGRLIRLLLLSAGIGAVQLLFLLFLGLRGKSGSATNPYVSCLVLFQLVLNAVSTEWVLRQCQALYSTRVVAVYDDIPAEQRRTRRWDLLLHPLRHSRFRTLFSLLLKALGIGGFVGAFILAEALQKAAGELAGLTGMILGLVIFLPSALLLYAGYRLGFRSAETVLGCDTRKPSLYLRSFSDDGRNDFNPKGTLAQSLGLQVFGVFRFLGPVANVYPIRLLRLCFSTCSDTAEEQLSHFFRKKGPFIAIGRPGELLPTGGAARAYVGHDQWQDHVRQWVSAAEWIVLQPAETEGVWWEIAEVLRLVPDKVLFCLVNYRGNQHGYERFASKFQQMTGINLPRFVGHRCFFWLENRRPHFSAPILRWPFAWPFSGCAVNFDRTLRAYFARNEDQSRTLAPEASPLWGLNALLALAFWLVVASLPAIAISSAVTTRAQARKRASILAAVHNSEFVIYGRPGFRWRLRQPFKEDVSNGGFFKLENGLVAVTGEVSGFAAHTALVTAQRDAVMTATINNMGQTLGARPELRQRAPVSIKGREWLEAVFDVQSPKARRTRYRYICRVTVDQDRQAMLLGWTPLPQEFEAVLREALDAFELLPPKPRRTLPSTIELAALRPATNYIMKLDQSWKEVKPSPNLLRRFQRGSTAGLAVAAQTFTNQNPNLEAAAAHYLKQLQTKHPEAEVVLNEKTTHHGEPGWLAIVRYRENERDLFVMRLSILAGPRIYYFTGISLNEQGDHVAIEDALNTCLVLPPGG